MEKEFFDDDINLLIRNLPTQPFCFLPWKSYIFYGFEELFLLFIITIIFSGITKVGVEQSDHFAWVTPKGLKCLAEIYLFALKSNFPSLALN